MRQKNSGLTFALRSSSSANIFPLYENEVIAHVSNSGTSSEANGLPNGYHLHFSLATSGLLWVDKIPTANANVFNWDDEEINEFLDPLAYFN